MYRIWRYITEPIGNNEFSYQERIAMGSGGKIFVPSMKQWTVSDLETGSEVDFEEVEDGKLKSHQGLKHFIRTSYAWVPTYIIDNHNHALTFRYQYRLNVWSFERLVVIHIDQHADTKPNEKRLEEDIETFVNEKTNVGNFISAALHNHIIDEVIQIRTDYALKHLDISSFGQISVIVDIDADFRADKEIGSEDIRIIQALMKKAKLITIATSPFFIDQQEAIEMIQKILWQKDHF